MIVRYLLALLLIAQLACGAFAQQTGTAAVGPPPPPPQRTTQQPQRPDGDDVVKITSNLVQVDAVVTDSSGKAITDLKPEEVQIFEDGKPQTISHFTYYLAGTAPLNPPTRPAAKAKVDEVAAPIKPEPLKREDVHRTIAIVVDDLGLSFESIAYMRRALKKFVDEQMQERDLVAIIRTGGSVGALQQFTSDKRQLYAVIERIRWNLLGRTDTSAFSAITRPDLKIPDEHSGRGENPKAVIEDNALHGMFSTLRYVVHGLREMPGRKSVLLVSDGFQLNQGEIEATSQVEALGSLTELANRASVVIYTVDARGLVTFGLQAQDNVQMQSAGVSRQDLRGLGRSVQDTAQLMTMQRRNFQKSQDGLNYLAQQTGGIPIRDTNDFSGGIQKVLDDQRGYYLIGYRPDETTFDAKSGGRKFHHLTLKVTRKGSFNVRMRNGFYGVNEAEIKPPLKSTSELMLNGITSPFSSHEVHLELTSLFGNDAANGSFMRSLLHIDARDLTFKDGPNGTHEGTFDVLAMTFGDNGVPVDSNGQTFTVQFPEAEYQRALRQGFVYNVTVPIRKPGAYHFRVALRDTATERVGSAGEFIQVPDIKSGRLALSGVVLTSSNADARSVVASAGGPNAEASPALRRFRQGMQLEWGYLIYNAQPDKATGKPQLTTEARLFREGKQVFTGGALPFIAGQPGDLRRMAASGALILGTDLAPGEYVLQIIVTDSLADKKYRVATQWMDFEIVK
jgi:VWFA-related protein